MSDHSNSEAKHPAVDKTVYQKGFYAFIALAVLTGIEYVLGTLPNPSAVLLILMAVAKAAIVMNVFMGITKLWRGGDHH
ncbi:MAG: hypothetical protein ACI9EW_000065 [Cellvibrionaceae bacterium]|jgi:hypothetical protein